MRTVTTGLTHSPATYIVVIVVVVVIVVLLHLPVTLYYYHYTKYPSFPLSYTLYCFICYTIIIMVIIDHFITFFIISVLTLCLHSYLMSCPCNYLILAVQLVIYLPINAFPLLHFYILYLVGLLFKQLDDVFLHNSLELWRLFCVKTGSAALCSDTDMLVSLAERPKGD